MAKLHVSVKYALDRFLANIEAGNGSQLIKFMMGAEKRKTTTCCTFFGFFPTKAHPVLSLFEDTNRIRYLDRSLLSKALDDYLESASNTVKTSFIRQILEHYDLSDDLLNNFITEQAVYYLRKQNFIIDFRWRDGVQLMIGN